MFRLALFIGIVASLAGCDDSSEAKLVASGTALLAKKDYAGAVIQFKNALEKNPRSAAARLALGRALLEAGDPVTAQIELRKAQEEQAPDDQVVPEIARALLATGDHARLIAQYRDLNLESAGAIADLKTSLATAHAAQGDLGQARQVAASALQAQPGNAPATVLLARLDAAEGDIASALQQLDGVLAREAGHADAGLVKSQILLQLKNEPDAALAALREVLAVHPQSVAARAAALDILILQNRRSEARADFEQLKETAPRHPETSFLQARLAFEDKDYKASREITQRLLVATPDHVRVLLLAAASEFATQNYMLAQSLLSRALKNAPDLLIARHLLAQAYLRDALPEKAIEVLQPAIEGPKADATSLGLAGQAYLQTGDHKRSESAFQRALKAAPGDARVRTSLAIVQLARGDTGAAIPALEAIAKAEGSTQADLALLSARWRQNDLKGALASIDALAKKLPDQAYPLSLRGRVQGQLGDMAGAAVSFEQALLKQPDHFPAVDGLAAIDLHAGKPEEARKRFQALLKVDPKNFRAQLALAELETRLGAPEAVVVAQLKEAVRIDPSQRVTHTALIERLLASGDVQGALAAAQDATAALPNDLVVMDALGRAQMASGGAQQAVSTFKKLAALEPKKVQPQLRLADAHLAGEDKESAARALRQVLEIEPGNLMALRGQALLAVMNGRPQEGIAIARSIQRGHPKDVVGYALEGEIQATLKNWGPAAAAYAAALQRGKSTDFAIRQHHCLSAGGKRPEADRLAAEWRRSNPRDAVFLYYLGDAAAAAENWAAAETHYRDVVALQPRHAAAVNNIAWLMVKQGKPGAVQMAEQANALLPERATLLDTLALALEADNQLPRAAATQKRAVALDPKDALLRLRLAKLYLKQGDKSGAREVLEALTKLNDGSAARAEAAALLKTL